MRRYQIVLLNLASFAFAVLAFTFSLHAEDEHEHPSEGPHKGLLIELGDEEYHAEIVHDDKTYAVTVYILDSGAKKAVPIEAKEVFVNVKHEGKPEQFKLPASPDKSDPKGMCSRFSLKDEELCHHHDDPKASPMLRVKIKGKSFSGKIPAGHDHKHEDDDHKHEKKK